MNVPLNILRESSYFGIRLLIRSNKMVLINNYPIHNITLIKSNLVDLILIKNYNLTKISNYITLISILTRFCV